MEGTTREDCRTKKPKVKGDPGESSNSEFMPPTGTFVGEMMTVSDFVTSFDEAAKRRLQRMSQKLRCLEMQMEVLEAEMNKADGSSKGV